MRGMGVRLHRGLTRALALAALAACAACGGGGVVGGNPPPTPHPDAAVTALVAADSTPLASIDPAAVTDDDLAAFGAAVGERRIVLLTEATHGDGATFRLKTRLVRYLHERMGFDVLFVESGLYDTVRIRQRLDAGGARSPCRAASSPTWPSADSRASCPGPPTPRAARRSRR